MLCKHEREFRPFTRVKNMLLTAYSSQLNNNVHTMFDILQIPRCEGGVRMLQIHSNAILIGTTVNSILLANFGSQEKPIDDSSMVKLPLTQVHAKSR